MKLRDGSEIARWAEKSPEDLVETWKAIWAERGKNLLARPLVETADECRQWLVGTPLEHAKLRPWKADLCAQLMDIEKRLDDFPWLAELRETAKVPRGLKKEHWPSIEANETVKKLLESVRDAIVAWVQVSQWNDAATLQAAEQALKLARLALDAREEYRQAKRAISSLDFDDLIVETRDLLRDHAADLGDDTEHDVGFVLVDEFQDTDPVQAEILRGLAGLDFKAKGLFLVGDFKQSIYRFRGAQPQLFREFRDAFPEPGRLALTENFRSATGIIQFVNRLFQGEFSEDEPELIPGPDASRPDGPFPVEFLWAAEPVEDLKEKRSVDDERKIEAQWLARRIRSGIDAGWTVKDRKIKTPRQAHPGDVAILFRTLNDLASYENALFKEGLDYYVVGGKAFYNQQEVHDLINILSWIEDPFDAVALAATLRSPFFAVSDEGLFWLGTAFEKDLVANLERFGEIRELSPTDSERVSRAQSLLSNFRGLKDRIPMAELMDCILAETGYETALLGEFLGDRKRGNARKLVKLARSFDDQPGFTLAQFVARLRADQRKPPSEGEAGTTNEDGKAVRLMTIHQAKGLEFPIVVIPDLNRGKSNKTSLMTFRSEMGPVIHAKATPDDDSNEFSEEAETEKTLGSTLFKILEKSEEAEEAIRLFYVATTRARDHLILSAPFDPRGNKPGKSEALRLLGSKFDLNTGRSIQGEPPIEVQVTSVSPPARETPRARKARPRLRAMSRIIRMASPVEPASDSSPLMNPTKLCVDLGELQGLDGRAQRLDQFLRKLLTDPKVFHAGELAEVSWRTARRQVPVIQDQMLNEAVRLLEPWCEGSIQNMFDDSLLVERGMTWTLAWPLGSPAATVFQGWVDFLLRDALGIWTVLNVSGVGSPPLIERLRLKLSARAAEALGMGPVSQAWRISLGSLEPAEGDCDFSDQSIAELIKDIV